jgi:hypothetical protein
MATENILVITVAGQPPVVVADDNPELVGQAILDYRDANPSTPEFAVSVRPGTRETPDA